MLKLDLANKRFEMMPKQAMKEAGFSERYDLQQWIWNSANQFSQEIDEASLLIIGREVVPSDTVRDRIDLLGYDNGALVIIELKRDSNKFQLLQALSYAGMIAKVGLDKLPSLPGVDKEIWNQVRAADNDTPALERSERIILIAEEFDFEVLVAAEWLSVKGVDIKCVRATFAVDDGKSEDSIRYATFSTIFPPSKIEEEARQRGSGRSGISVADRTGWAELLEAHPPSPAVEFFRLQLQREREASIVAGSIYFRLQGVRRFIVWLKSNFATVEQYGRFNGDENFWDDGEFWQDRLSDCKSVREVYGGKRLRFALHTHEDFTRFETSVAELAKVPWDQSLAEAIARCENAVAKQFFEVRQQSYPKNGSGTALKYERDGEARWYIEPTPNGARVNQLGRFMDDEAIWGTRQLRFHKSACADNLVFGLSTPEDFERFENIVEKGEPAIAWLTRE